MRRKYDEVGVGTVSVPPALRNLLEEPNSRRVRIGEPSARVSMPPTYRNLTTPKGLRNGQMISATENYTDVLTRSRQEEALDRQQIYQRVSDFLAGYYSYDSEKYAEERSALQQQANVEKAQMMTTEPDYEEPEVVPREVRQKPQAIVSQTREEAKFVNDAIKELEKAGVPVEADTRFKISELTPALLLALKQGYPTEKGMKTAITRFRRLGREIFTEEREAKIRELTLQNVAPAEESESPLNTGFYVPPGSPTRAMEDIPRGEVYDEFATARRVNPLTGVREPPRQKLSAINDLPAQEQSTAFRRVMRERVRARRGAGASIDKED